MSILCICNSTESDLGHISDCTSLAGQSIQFVYREDLHSLRTADPNQHDLLIMLGSTWSTYWAHVNDFVRAEIEIIRKSHAFGTPILGICFGAQILSAAFGGNVVRMPTPEIGWRKIDGIVPNSPLTGTWMQWHFDAFTAPSGFEMIAKNDAGVQAIRGGRSLGVQFHPEANESIVSEWIQGDGGAELAEAGITQSDLLDQTRRQVERTSTATQKLMDWFLEDVAHGQAAMPSSN